jgi:hypothetical protein
MHGRAGFGHFSSDNGIYRKHSRDALLGSVETWMSIAKTIFPLTIQQLLAERRSTTFRSERHSVSVLLGKDALVLLHSGVSAYGPLT